MTARSTKEEINAKLIESNRNLLLIGNYVGNKTKTLFRCLVCNHEWEARSNDILCGKGCPCCANKRKKLTKEQQDKRKLYIISVLEETKRNILFVGDYIANNKKSLFRCLVCDYEWEAKPNNILSGYGCPCCANKRKKLTKEQRELKKQEFNDNLQNDHRDIILIGEYISALTKTLFRCLVCNHEWDAKPNSILNGNGCACCANRLSLTFEEVNKRLEDNNRTVRLMGNYSKTQEDSLFKCLVCNHEWETRPGNVLYNNSGCPICADHGFDFNIPAILYYIEINHNDKLFYKIGITNFSVNKRFTNIELEKIKILHEFDYKFGIDAYNKEQEILKEFNEYRYSGEPILKSGNTEIFVEDIRNLNEKFSNTR